MYSGYGVCRAFFLTLQKPPALNAKQSGAMLTIQTYLEFRSNNFGSVGSLSHTSPRCAA